MVDLGQQIFHEQQQTEEAHDKPVFDDSATYDGVGNNFITSDTYFPLQVTPRLETTIPFTTPGRPSGNI
jgi:hypothetical protein